MKRGLSVPEIGLWCALVLIAAFPHELSHFLVAKVLGHGAEIVYFAYIPYCVRVSLSSGSSMLHVALIASAGGIGTAIFLYLLWRMFGRRGTLVFAFFIPMQLSYAVLETMYHLGWVGSDAALLCGLVGFAGFLKYKKSLSRSLRGQLPCLKNRQTK